VTSSTPPGRGDARPEERRVASANASANTEDKEVPAATLATASVTVAGGARTVASGRRDRPAKALPVGRTGGDGRGMAEPADGET
jgi:hypothetical protein